MFYATARADSVVTYSVCRITHPVDGRDMLLGGSARVVYKSYSRRPRLLCRGDGNGRKGGTSFRRELGLGRVARASLLYADEVVGRYILADDDVAALAESMYVVAFNTWKRDGGKHRPHRIWGGELADS